MAKSSLLQQHETKIRSFFALKTFHFGMRTALVQEKCQNAISKPDRAPRCLPSSAIVARGAICERFSTQRSSESHTWSWFYIKDERWWHRTQKPRWESLSRTHTPPAETHIIFYLIQAGGRATNSFTYNIHPEEIKIVWRCRCTQWLHACIYIGRRVTEAPLVPHAKGYDGWASDASIDISARTRRRRRKVQRNAL